jgi:hypothetical protein
MIRLIIVCSLVAFGCLVGCTTSRKSTNNETISFNSVVKAMPAVVIYKTKKDYSQNVPVGLSEDKMKIVSYPAISDVKIGGKYPYPTQLEDGYLLDNRGISQNVAFLSYTYEEYAALSATPSVSTLMEKIIDKDPLIEIHNCGNRSQYNNLIKELNEMIRSGKFK